MATTQSPNINKKTDKQSPCVQRIASISIVTTARVQGSPGLVVHRAGVAVVWHNTVSGSVSRGQHSLYTVASLSRVAGEDTAAAAAAPRLFLLTITGV